MGENSDLDKTKLLIDFSSPVSIRPLDSPLIPVPWPPGQLSVSPTNSNPFDVAERQTASLDPFDCVFEKAIKNNNEQGSGGKFPLLCKGRESNGGDELNKTSFKNIKTSQENFSEDSVKYYEVGEKVCQTKGSSKLKCDPNSVVVSEADSQSQSFVDLSTTEEGLKAEIAKRVNNCIQKVLNNSLKCQLSQSNDTLNLVSNKASVKKMYNRRALSFVMDSKKNTICDRLNRSCVSSSYNDLKPEKEKLESPDSSFGLCDSHFLRSFEGEVSQSDNSVFLPTENELVFKEANKLARTFSKIAESFCQDLGSDNEDDLMSCKPRWLYADSSEDEEEKLLRDPALNIRVSLTPAVPSQPDSNSLTAFKTRIRQSLEHVRVGSAEVKGEVKTEIDIKRAHSLGTEHFETETFPSSTKPAPIQVDLEKFETNQIKLKKSSTVDFKRGPMKAVMPVQSMTKDSFLHGKASNPETSPIRKHGGLQLMETPKRDHNRSGPVASSTPHKSGDIVPSPLLTSISIPKNKRRSLGEEVNHKSRTPEVSSGARERSNSVKSVYSSIPTPISFKELSAKKSPFSSKSTSSLTSRSSVNSQTNPQPDNKVKQIKPSFNPRALNEVKSKPLTKNGRIKGAVTALSSLVSGKSKKVAVRDKENRFPV